MARDGDILFSVITPSTGRRPKALGQAVKSVEQAARFAGLEEGQVEILIGFDGKKSRAPACGYPVHAFNLPGGKNRGNGVRNMLLKVAAGDKLLFLDDDNTIKPYTMHHYLRHFDAEMIIGRIDTQLAFDTSFLPVQDSGPLIRPGNVDPLCLCLSRRLVMGRCGGWGFAGQRDADYLNIARWYDNAQSVTVIEEVVGVFDSGRSLDGKALSRRQKQLLDRLAARRGASAPGRTGGLAAYPCLAPA